MLWAAVAASSQFSSKMAAICTLLEPGTFLWVSANAFWIVFLSKWATPIRYLIALLRVILHFLSGLPSSVPGGHSRQTALKGCFGCYAPWFIGVKRSPASTSSACAIRSTSLGRITRLLFTMFPNTCREYPALRAMAHCL